MNTKKLLSIAIMLALPLGANAGYTYVSQSTPAKVPSNGTVIWASHGGPYVTATIEADDDEHIASTAYVKGAYNDTIAGLNNKQDLLINSLTDDVISDAVVGALDFVEELAGDISAISGEQYLISSAAVKDGIKSQRVEVYTNWDDDTEKTDVAFKTVVPED